VTIICSIAAAAGGYIIHLGTRVQVLEYRVIPFVQGQLELTRIEDHVEYLDKRMVEVEGIVYNAQKEAGTPPGHAKKR
jgi:uncharacterized coiled-coil protein SlyX